MRRLITTLAILLVVIVAGMTALVLLVNPNDFRTYMVNQVEQRSGYKLTLEGSLRWHVWPQLSILAGRMTLTAPGATEPMVSAENMRLDVHLLPLLSHQLSVKEVMLKGAIIRLTPQSKVQRPADAPVAPGNLPDTHPIDEGWKFDIASLQVADSLLIWQQPGGEQINFRDIALSMSQNEHQQAHIELSSRVNRDQRDLQLNLNADMNVADYPRQLTGVINSLDYTLKGADLPVQGVSGKLGVNARWREDQTFALDNLSLSANDTVLTGSLSGTLAAARTLNLNLQAANLNLDALLGSVADNSGKGAATGENTVSGKRPVIADPVEFNHQDSLLNQFRMQIALSAQAMQWRNMTFSNVTFAAYNQRGDITIHQFSGNSQQGHFSLPGRLDIRDVESRATFTPSLQNIEIAPLLKAFDMPESLAGALTLDGTFSGMGLSVEDVKQRWKGSAKLSMNNAQLLGLNFQQLVQRAVANNSSNRVQGAESDVDYTEINQLSANAQLNRGALKLEQLKGAAAILNLAGSGDVDIARRQCDFTFQVTVTGGWRGDSELAKTLSETPIPMRIYGDWNALNYTLDVGRPLRQRLEDEARQRLRNWADNNQDKQRGKDVKQFLNSH
ncbi:outer membrane assembly protein AsmA [Enterobacterales bacterium CwR94]|nr:outer membrane assembly protein AsmA [Enterobacterales bacterium CwR94]